MITGAALRRPGVRFAIVLTLALFTAVDTSLRAAETPSSRRSRLDARLQQVVDDRVEEPQRVIIRVRRGSRASLKDALRRRGDAVVAEHESIDALTAMVHAADLPALAADRAVLSVSTDAIVHTSGLLGGLVGVVGGLVDVGTDIVDGILVGGSHVSSGEKAGPAVLPIMLRKTLALPSTWSGRGVVVAVVDSGLEMSDEFAGRVLGFYDLTGGDIVQTTPYDDYGHGTHVAGTIGGSGALNSTHDYRSLAPNVKFVILKALDKTGAGLTSNVIRAVDFAVANRDRFGIDIINLSLGHPIYEPAETDPLVQAVERATRAGIIVVTSAGNVGRNGETGAPGYAGITSPGNAPSAITAGALQTGGTAVRGDDRIPDYSSAGPTWHDARLKPDLVAPGHNIVSVAARRGSLYKRHPELEAPDDGDYIRLSGTSMAAAVTSGVISLMLEAHQTTQGSDAPPLTPNTVKGALQYSALEVRDDTGAAYDPLRQGAGALNGRGAIELARGIDTTAAAGAAWLNPWPNPWTTIAGETLTWKQTVSWGTAIIWGSTLPVHHTAWGSAIIWGSQDVWDDAIIWGSHDAVWTDPHAWASAIIWGSTTIGVDNGTAIIWGSTSGLTPSTTVFKTLDQSITMP